MPTGDPSDQGGPAGPVYTWRSCNSISSLETAKGKHVTGRGLGTNYFKNR